jgi:hypothetical protein
MGVVDGGGGCQPHLPLVYTRTSAHAGIWIGAYGRISADPDQTKQKDVDPSRIQIRKRRKDSYGYGSDERKILAYPDQTKGRKIPADPYQTNGRKILANPD